MSSGLKPRGAGDREPPAEVLLHPQLALDGGGRDNVSVVVVEAVEVVGLAETSAGTPASAPSPHEESEVDEDTLPRPTPGEGSSGR